MGAGGARKHKAEKSELEEFARRGIKATKPRWAKERVSRNATEGSAG